MSKTDTTSPDWATDLLTAEEIDACRHAGASQAFIEVLETDCPDGVSRHSVRQETKKQLRSWDKSPEDMTTLAGDFFTALWNGNRGRYRGHADSNNQQILRAAGVV